MQRLSLLLAAVVLCAVLLVAGCGDNKQPNPAVSAPPPAVTVVKVTAAEIKPAKTFTGRIEAKDKVDLRVRVDGFLEKRLFTEGADVKEGELLFVIEKGLYQAAVDHRCRSATSSARRIARWPPSSVRTRSTPASRSRSARCSTYASSKPRVRAASMSSTSSSRTAAAIPAPEKSTSSTIR